jgi:UDP-N-acetylmuramate dehydrogenase
MRAKNPNQPLFLARDTTEVLNYLRQSAQEGDLLMIVGAGDVERIGQEINTSPIKPAANAAFALLSAYFKSNEVTLRANEPLAQHTFFRAGGKADIYAEPQNIAALSALMLFCKRNEIPVQTIGGGSNAWFSDFGVPGVLCALKGACFEQYHREGDTITVGAGLLGAVLLDKLEANGLSGLEFMHGIPGTVGGWARMNAGAHQHAVWERITEIRVALSDGQLRHIPADAITYGYRSVRGISGMTILSVTFRLTPNVPRITIHEARMQYHAKRTHFAGLRTCGSLFKNDPAFSAGVELDKLGAKSWRIGGAFVAPVHANVIATDDACNGSDILALMQKMRHELQMRTQIEFTPEVQGF